MNCIKKYICCIKDKLEDVIDDVEDIIEDVTENVDTIKENVYRKENPNTYLAKFAQFVIKHKEVPEMKDIIFVV